jgi:DnaJ-class molecular chaperone
MDNTVDATIDFYEVLGLTSVATPDEIKNAHVALALKYHPDLSTVDDGGKRFRAISEAWAILGKQDRRQSYDLERMRILGSKSYYASGGASAVSTEISAGFQTQKSNFDQAVKANAMSNWKEMQDKYKSESWQRLPLSEKKLHRIRGVQTVGGTVMPIFLTLAFVGFCGYTYYNSMIPKRRPGIGSVSR